MLAVVGPLALFPGSGRFLALLAIPAWWVWRWARRAPGFEAHFIPRTPLDVAVLLLLCMVLVSAVVTYDIAASLPKIAGVIYGVGVFYAAAHAARQPRPGPAWVGLGVFLLAGAGIAGLALLGTEWPVKFAVLEALLAWLPVRLSGLPGAEAGFNSSEVAGSLLWVLPLALALTAAAAGRVGALRARLGGWRSALIVLGLAALSLFMLGVFLLTQSRGGLIGLGLALFAMTLAAARKHPFLVFAILAATAVMAGALVVAAIAFGPGRFLRLALGLGGDAQSASLYTLESRIEIWTRAVYGIQDFAYTGMGMNTFRLLVHRLYPLYAVPPGRDIAHAHNLWLQAALDLGVPGLVAYAALWLGAGSMLASIWRSLPASGIFKQRNEETGPAAASERAGLWPLSFSRAIAAGLGGGLLSHFVYGLTDAIALGAKPGVVWWLMLGLIAGLFRQAQASQTK